MIKTKEHNFLGDDFTNNIKYADNAWQAYGSVNRRSMFMPQSILASIFEETEYDADAGRFVKFKPRFSVDGDVVPNTLPHDLILFDTNLYSSTATTSEIKNSDIVQGVTKGFGVNNPLYDVHSNVKKIKIFEDANFNTITVKSFIQTLCPDEQVYGQNDDLSEAGRTLLKNLAKRYGTFNGDTEITQLANGHLTDLVGDGREQFIEDFSLRLHEPDSIKLPFHKFNHKNSVLTTSDLAKYIIRFFSNHSANLVKSRGAFSYVESVSNIFEEDLAARKFTSGNQHFFEYTTGLNDRPGVGQGLDKPLEGYDYEIPATEKTVFESALNFFINNPDPVDFLPPVYVGAQATQVQQGRGLFLTQEEDKAAILKEDDVENYSIYSDCSLGYKTVDDLISQRTFLGTTNNLSMLDQSGEVDRLDFLFNSSKRGSWDVVDHWHPGDKKYSTNYVTICTLVGLFKLAKGENWGTIAEFAVSGKSTTKEFIVDTDTKPLYDWLNNECFLYAAPIFGDLVESLEFQQDLNEQANVDFKNLRLSSKPAIKNKYTDSLNDLPYVEQTMPLINLGGEDAEAVASKYLPGAGTAKLDPLKSNNITPPFIYDYHKKNEAAVTAYDAIKTGEKKYNKDGQLLAEDGIISPTIDALWEYIKYLTESDKSDALPTFYGMSKDVLGNESLPANTVKPNESNVDAIDILRWNILADTELKLGYSNGLNSEVNELLPGGYEVTKYIQKVYDYKVDFFGRNGKEGYNDKIEGYLESLQNLIAAALSLDSTIDRIPTDGTGLTEEIDSSIRSVSTGTNNKLEIAELNAAIMNFDDSYKKYADHPKNLKTIERELETIRQNLRALAKFTTVNYIPLGVLDRGTGKGNLHLLHRDAGAKFTDCIIDLDNIDGNYDSYKNDDMNNKVIFNGESKVERNKIKNFGSKVLEPSDDTYTLKDVDKHTNINTTELRDVYLGADGLWHSIHETTILTIVDDWNEWLVD